MIKEYELKYELIRRLALVEKIPRIVVIDEEVLITADVASMAKELIDRRLQVSEAPEIEWTKPDRSLDRPYGKKYRRSLRR